MSDIKTKPVVWVITEGNNDYTPAERFGTVKFITDQELRPSPASMQTHSAHADLRDFHKEYRPEVDYIVPTGNPVLIVLLGLILGRHRNHLCLKWDSRTKEYTRYNISYYRTMLKVEGGEDD